MSSNISKNNKLLVVSDTGMVFNNKGKIKAFSPVVKELHNLLTVFDEITWIGFERKSQEKNKSYIAIDNPKIKPIFLKEVGGRHFFSKLKIIFAYPKMIFYIFKHIKKHKYIHSRAPSNPSVIVMFFSILFRKKIFWHKYAGSWIDKASFFYRVQRMILSNLNANSKITINGDFSSKKNIFSFENPCLDEVDRNKGRVLLKNKKITNKINFCYVGELNKNKGVDKILKAFSIIKSNKIGVLHIVGDSASRKYYENLAKEIKFNFKFHGFLPKDEIYKIYKDSHFILLPSKSEGFPKVIGEAMNYSCVPIVSNVSCMDQYIINNKNGFLLRENTINCLVDNIQKALLINNNEFINISTTNFKLSNKFTYSYYNNRLKNEIFLT